MKKRKVQMVSKHLRKCGGCVRGIAAVTRNTIVAGSGSKYYCVGAGEEERVVLSDAMDLGGNAIVFRPLVYSKNVFLTCCNGGYVRGWKFDGDDLSTVENIMEIKFTGGEDGRSRMVQRLLRISDDSPLVLAVVYDMNLQIIDVSRKKVVKPLSEYTTHGRVYFGLCNSKKYKNCFYFPKTQKYSNKDCRIKLIDGKEDKVLKIYSAHGDESCHAVDCFINKMDDEILVAGCCNEKMYFYHSGSGDCINTIHVGMTVNSLKTVGGNCAFLGLTYGCFRIYQFSDDCLEVLKIYEDDNHHDRGPLNDMDIVYTETHEVRVATGGDSGDVVVATYRSDLFVFEKEKDIDEEERVEYVKVHHLKKELNLQNTSICVNDVLLCL